MKAGLEVHQQLATGKLFCACPSELSDAVTGTFSRRLRASSGENRGIDAAAAHQASRGLTYRYETTEANCLVEMDEEPPHALNPAALDTALTLARMLHARVLDEIEVMRKIVVDGSNTSGFQRTALVAAGGYLELGKRRYSILSICLEEDAARKISEKSGEVLYRLDRLGIPLVEIATGPDLTTPEEAREVAEEIGALLRATRRVRRGIGTIREDLNVSTEGGRRIEIKGVQELRRLPQYAEREVERQRVLLEVRDRLRGRNAASAFPPALDVTELLGAIESGPVADAVRHRGVVLAIALPGFAGLLKSPPNSEERLGRELADQARFLGLRGILHSDELPGAGIGAEETERLRTRLGSGPNDAFVLVADRSAERARAALDRIAARALAALDGIPAETRDPLPDGRSRFSRPLPGRDRMYPETDVAPIPISAADLARIDAGLPERPAVLRERLAQEYHLVREVVRQLVAGGHVDAFEALAHQGHAPAVVARLLTQDLPAAGGGAEREWPLALLGELLSAQESGRFAKEGFPAVLAALTSGAPTVDEAIAKAGLSGMPRAELDRLVDRIVDANRGMIVARREDAFSPLMGDLMREVRGQRDGQEVAAALREGIARVLSEPRA
ncbi:MAG TPA: Glu-tRNA(Gln) amidotransferase subunit GatE [Thermoplasmata archaeon]|nr:Glu-tRNA(Gln) amidotransferase subunit GatE [Thermoplasmata archaeon]